MSSRSTVARRAQRPRSNSPANSPGRPLRRPGNLPSRRPQPFRPPQRLPPLRRRAPSPGVRPRPVPPPLPGRAPRLAPSVARRFPLVAAAFGVGEYAYRHFNGWEAIPAAPAGWVLVHGTNFYDPLTHNPANRRVFDIGYLPRTGPFGSQTALIAGQAIPAPGAADDYASFGARLAAFPGVTHMGEWLESNGIATRGASLHTWMRPVTPADLVIARQGYAAPNYWGRPYPLPDPFAPHSPQPAGSPLPNPRPLPNTSPRPGHNPTPDPYPSPFELPSIAPVAPLIALVGDVMTITVPDVVSVPGARPSFPTRDFVTLPNGRSYARNGRHHLRRPRKREHERKPTVARVLYGFLNAFGAATEAQDLVDAAWQALPKHLRTKSFHGGNYVRPSFDKRQRDVYNHYREIDLEQFLKNVLANQLEDAFIGRQDFTSIGGRPNPGITQFRRENRDIDPTQSQPIDFDAVVEQIWEALEATTFGS